MRRESRGGAKAGEGMMAIVYMKPEKEIEDLLPEGCEWKDEYVAKVFRKGYGGYAKKEWKFTRQLANFGGIIVPESQCVLTDGRQVLFSKNGGPSLASLFYDPYGRPIKKSAEVIPALEMLRDQVGKMNKEGIVHMDIQSGNIVYDGKLARLIDFGLSEMAGKSDDETGEITKIIDQLKPTAGGSTKSRRKTRKPKRRTQRHRLE